MHDGNTDEEDIHGGEIMSNRTNEVYSNEYYKDYLGAPDYFHNQEIKAFAKDVAGKIKARFSPKTVLDIGCACGHFVKALREIGIDAWGVDGSKAALEAAEPSMKRYLGEVEAPFACLPKHFPQKYDLVISIETFEHFSDDFLDGAVNAICKLGNRILFSSSPWAYEDPTHLNIHLPSYWARLASFVSPQAFCLLKSDVVDNEGLLFSLLDLHVEVNRRLMQGIDEWRKLSDERLSIIEAQRKALELKDAMLEKQGDLKEETESMRQQLMDSKNDRAAKEKALREQNELKKLLENRVSSVEAILASMQKTLTEKEAYVQELLERENLLRQEICASNAKEVETAKECAEEVIKIATRMEEEKAKLVKKIGESVSELEMQQEIAHSQLCELQKLKNVNLQEREVTDSLRKEMQAMTVEITRILNSRSYKLAQRIKRIYHLFKRG